LGKGCDPPWETVNFDEDAGIKGIDGFGLKLHDFLLDLEWLLEFVFEFDLEFDLELDLERHGLGQHGLGGYALGHDLGGHGLGHDLGGPVGKGHDLGWHGFGGHGESLQSGLIGQSDFIFSLQSFPSTVLQMVS